MLTYTDGNLCNLEYTYYVRASHPFETFESKSNKAALKPIYIYNTSNSAIKKVSVVSQNQIEILWNKSSYANNDNYILRKFSSVGANPLDEIELTDTSYVDYDVKTDAESYIYVVTEKDKCGYINEAGRYGKSILLKGNYINQNARTNESRLWWSKYEDWEKGVKNYNILLYDVPETRVIGTTISDTSFIDPEYHEQIIEHYCYQVYATNEIQDTSFSNIICVNGKANVAIPTAFSPNKDGLNDHFKPVTQFVKQSEFSGVKEYSFTIYNRWGEKLFETNDLTKGWTGKYQGTNCQSGIYLYTISVKSLDNYIANYSGYVSLIR